MFLPPNCNRCIAYIAAATTDSPDVFRAEGRRQFERCKEVILRLREIADTDFIYEAAGGRDLAWCRRSELKRAIALAVDGYLLIESPTVIAFPFSIEYALFAAALLANRTTLVACTHFMSSEVSWAPNNILFSQGLTIDNMRHLAEAFAQEVDAAIVEENSENTRDKAYDVELPELGFVDDMREQLHRLIDSKRVANVSRLAKEVGVSQPTLYRFLHQDTTPGSQVSLKLLAYLKNRTEARTPASGSNKSHPSD